MLRVRGRRARRGYHSNQQETAYNCRGNLLFLYTPSPSLLPASFVFPSIVTTDSPHFSIIPTCAILPFSEKYNPNTSHGIGSIPRPCFQITRFDGNQSGDHADRAAWMPTCKYPHEMNAAHHGGPFLRPTDAKYFSTSRPSLLPVNSRIPNCD